MRFISLFTGLATVTVVSSLTVRSKDSDSHGDFDVDHHFGASVQPWNHGAHPGWYFGNDYDHHKDLFCLTPHVCKHLDTLKIGFRCPHGPPPPAPYDGYLQTFSDLTGATQASDYLTFGLVETVADCISMCNNVQGCNFVNTYHDVNGKNGSPLLTCSLFKNCHDASDATNRGGQTQPDGSIDYITNSDGWCKQ